MAKNGNKMRMRSRRSARKAGRGGNSASLFGLSTLEPGVNTHRYVQQQTGLTPFPLRWNTRLTYGLNVALGTVGSIPTASKHRLALNGAYDVDVTGTGEQPYNWDQMIAIYTKYLVRKCYVDLTFSDPSTDGLWVGWSFHTNTTSNDDPVGKTLGDIMSRPTFRCVPINNTGAQVVTLREEIPLHVVFGLSEQQYSSMVLDYGSPFNANPTSLAYLDLFILDPNSLVTPHYVRVAGRLVFDIQFWDYAAPSGS